MAVRRRSQQREARRPEDPERAPALSPASPAAAIQALQRTAGNHATVGLLRGRAARVCVQRRWIVKDERDFFWEEEEGVDPDPDELPDFLRGMHWVPAPRKGTYSVDKGPRWRGKGRPMPLYFSLEEWRLLHPAKKPSRTRGDVFNPFGRFATGVYSFVPSRELSKEQQDRVLASLAEKDEQYKPIVGLGDQSHPSGYPLQVMVEGDDVLQFVEAGPFGAVYADESPRVSRASYDEKRAKDPSKLKLIGPSLNEKMEWAYKIDKARLDEWAGEKRGKSQKQVMGASAGDVAKNAGFVRDEGKGWEWLHMIAHSMGGTGVGPQVPENLVVGTGECNTQMIVVEEWLKDVVRRAGSGGYVTLFVGVQMFDVARHIGRSITYDFEVYNQHGEPTAVYHFAFDPLSRVQPLTAQNRSDRYGARQMFPEGGRERVTTHMPRSEPTAHRPDIPKIGAQGQRVEDPEDVFMDSALEILRTQPLEQYQAFLVNAKQSGRQASEEWFIESAGVLKQDQVLNYMRWVRQTFGERWLAWAVYGFLVEHQHNEARGWMLNSVLVPLYGQQPVPEKLRKQCQPV